MPRQHPSPITIVRRLRPSPERFGAAGALQDPNLLLQLLAARARGNRPDGPPRSCGQRVAPDRLARVPWRTARRG
jgi:hypothetical protein